MHKEYPIKLITQPEPPVVGPVTSGQYTIKSYTGTYDISAAMLEAYGKEAYKPLNWDFDSPVYQKLSKPAPIKVKTVACPGPGWIWCPVCKVWCGKWAAPDDPAAKCACCTKKAKQADANLKAGKGYLGSDEPDWL